MLSKNIFGINRRLKNFSGFYFKFSYWFAFIFEIMFNIKAIYEMCINSPSQKPLKKRLAGLLLADKFKLKFLGIATK